MKYHLTPIRKTIKKKKIKCFSGCGEKEILCRNIGGNGNWKSHYKKPYGSYLKSLKLPYDPAVSLSDIYLKKAKTLTRRYIFTALLTRAKT